MDGKENNEALIGTCLKTGFPLKPENGEWKTKGKGMGKKLLGHMAVTGDGLKLTFGESTVALF